MTQGSRHAALPPFLVGAALGISSVVAAGLLLYGGVGFVQALVVVIATLFASLALGVARGATPNAGEPIEVLRRRWLLLLFAFALASVFSGLWEVFRGMGARALTQGVGLALLAALPQYAGGSVLGTMRRIPDAPRGLAATAPAALLGAAAGVLVLGFLLFPTLSSTASLLVALVALSAAALVQGWVLDETLWVRSEINPKRREQGLRIEQWERGSPPLRRTALLRSDEIVGVVGKGSEPLAPLDALVDRGLRRWSSSTRRGLLLGGGTGAIALGRLAADPETELHLVDPDAALLEGWRSLVPEADRKRLHLCPHRPLRILLGREEGFPAAGFDFVVLHTSVSAPMGEPPELPSEVVDRLASLLTPNGILVMTPLRDEGRVDPILPMARCLESRFEAVSLYVGASATPLPVGDVPTNRVEAWRRLGLRDGGRPAVLVAGRGAGEPWPDRLDGHLQVRIREPATEGGP